MNKIKKISIFSILILMFALMSNKVFAQDNAKEVVFTYHEQLMNQDLPLLDVVGMPNQQTFKEGVKFTHIEIPSSLNYTFNYWVYYIDGNEQILKVGDRFFNDTDFYAVWTPTLRGIFYELDGGLNHKNNPNFFYGNNPITLLEPTKEGYKFLGWFDNNLFNGNEITTLGNQDKSITLYAKWEKLATKEEFLSELEILTNSITVGNITFDEENIAVSFSEGVDVASVKQAAQGLIESLRDVAGNNSLLNIGNESFLLSDADVSEIAKALLGDNGLEGFLNNGLIETAYTATVDYLNNPNVELEGILVFKLIGTEEGFFNRLEDLVNDIEVADVYLEDSNIIVDFLEGVNINEVKLAASELVNKLLELTGSNSKLYINDKEFILGSVDISELAKELLGNDGLQGFYNTGIISSSYTATIDYLNNDSLNISGNLTFKLIGTKEGFLDKLNDLITNIDVGTVTLDDENITVSFPEGVDVNLVKDVANDLANALLEISGEDSTLTINDQTFVLGNVDISELAKELLGEGGLAEFLEYGQVNSSYTANVVYLNNEIELLGNLNFNIIFDPRNVTFIDGDNTNVLIVDYNTKIEKPIDPEKENFEFIGWFIDNDLFDFNSYIKEDITLIAVYNLLTEKEDLINELSNLFSTINHATATIDSEDKIDVSFLDTVSIDDVLNAAQELLLALINTVTSGTLYINDKEFDLDTVDLIELTRTLLDGIDPEEFLDDAVVININYKANVLYKDLEVELDSTLNFNVEVVKLLEVSNEEELLYALSRPKVEDIYVVDNITLTNDLIVDREVNLYVNEHSLNINGFNIYFNYTENYSSYVISGLFTNGTLIINNINGHYELHGLLTTNASVEVIASYEETVILTGYWNYLLVNDTNGKTVVIGNLNTIEAINDSLVHIIENATVNNLILEDNATVLITNNAVASNIVNNSNELYYDEIRKFEIEFSYDNQIITKYVNSGNKVNFIEVEKVGHTFIMWLFNNEEFDFETVIKSDYLLIALFTINQYKLTYLVEGSLYEEIIYDYDALIGNISNPVKEGHSFVGWDNLPTYMPAEDTTVNALFNINTYSITYVIDGNEMVEEYLYDELVELPNNPTLTGYTFISWDKVIPTNMPAENLIINAVFEINSYSITYIVDGNLHEKFEDIDYDSPITLIDEPTKTGHSFSGWDILLPSNMPDSDLVLSGTFNINSYTITYMVDGTIYEEIETHVYNSLITIKEEPTKIGHTFSGWDKELPELMPAENIIINGTYSVNEYELTIYIDDSFTTYKFNYNTLVVVDTPVRNGYNFVSYNEELPELMPAENIILYTNWSIITYDITYILSGGVNNVNNPLIYTIETETINLEEPTKDYHHFIGWEKEGIIVDKIEKGSFGHVTLTATWEIFTYEVKYMDYKNELIDTEIVEHGSNAVGLTPDLDGYTFIGWDKGLTNITSDLVVNGIFEIILVGNEQKNNNDIYNIEYNNNALKTVNLATFKVPIKYGADVDANSFYSFTYYKDATLTEVVNSLDLSNGATTFKLYFKAVSNNDYIDLEGYIIIKYLSVSIDDTLYTIEDALLVSKSRDTIIVKYNTSFADSETSQEVYGRNNYEIKTGVKLLLPYKADDTGGLEDAIASASAVHKTNYYVRLNLTENLTLNVNGTLVVNALRGTAGTNFQGFVTGANYAILHLSENSKLNINGTLTVIGYIYGEGNIEAFTSAKVSETMFIENFRGGSDTLGVQGSVFPFTQFSLPNIEANLKINVGSTYEVSAAIYASSSFSFGNLTIVGSTSSSLIELTSGYITKSYNPVNGEIYIDLYQSNENETGFAQINDASLKAGSLNVGSRGKDMPFDGKWQFTLNERTELKINSHIQMLPGSSFNVKENATLVVAEDARFTIHNPYEYIEDSSKYNKYPVANLRNYFRTNPTFVYNAHSKAIVNVEGTFIVEDNASVAGYLQEGINSNIVISNSAITKYELKYVLGSSSASVYTREVEFFGNPHELKDITDFEKIINYLIKNNYFSNNLVMNTNLTQITEGKQVIDLRGYTLNLNDKTLTINGEIHFINGVIINGTLNGLGELIREEVEFYNVDININDVEIIPYIVNMISDIELEATNPIDLEEGITPGTQYNPLKIELVFDNFVNINDISKISIFDEELNEMYFYTSEYKNIAIIHAALEYEKTYTVIVMPGAITDAYGEGVTNSKSYSFSFTTKEAVYYEVNFDVNGGTPEIPSQTILEGMLIEQFSIPTNEEYILIGWIIEGTDEQISNLYDFNNPINENINLVAWWSNPLIITITPSKTAELNNDEVIEIVIEVKNEQGIPMIGIEVILDNINKAKIDGYEFDSMIYLTDENGKITVSFQGVGTSKKEYTIMVTETLTQNYNSIKISVKADSPFIYTEDEEGNLYFEHQPIPFKLVKTVEGTSFGTVRLLQAQDGRYYINIVEEGTSTTVLNNLELYAVDYYDDGSILDLLFDIYGNPHTIKEHIKPISFVDQYGNNYLEYIFEKDDNYAVVNNEDIMSYLEATFNRPTEGTHAKLIVSVQTSNNPHQLFLNAFDSINAKTNLWWLDKAFSNNLLAKKAVENIFNSTKLEVQLFNGQDWITVDYIEPTPYLMETYLLNIDLTNINTNDLKIRFVFGTMGMYMFDNIFVDYTDNEDMIVHHLNLESALLNGDIDVVEKLLNNNEYITLGYKEGIRLGFNAPNLEEGYNRTFGVKTTGFIYSSNAKLYDPLLDQMDDLTFSEIKDLLINNNYFEEVADIPLVENFYNAVLYIGSDLLTTEQRLALLFEMFQ